SLKTCSATAPRCPNRSTASKRRCANSSRSPVRRLSAERISIASTAPAANPEESLPILTVFCAGAAQAVVAGLAVTLEREGSPGIAAQYGGVHALKSRIVAGEAADAVILTDVLIDELIELGWVVRGARIDLGAVPTGIAVRHGAPVPDIADSERLRDTLLNAERVVCPDPAFATAGRALLEVLERLDIADRMRARLAYVSSGYAAISEVAKGRGDRELGVMQLSEIRAHDGVTLVGLLPRELQPAPVVYAAGVKTSAMHAQLGAA